MAYILSERIAGLRRERGLTQEQLGQPLGVSAQAVSKWEKGGAPDVELLPALADRLGVTVDALFGREGGAPVDMMDLACRYITSQPEGKRLDAICRMLFQATQTMMPAGILSEPVKFPSRCTLPDEAEGPSLLMRSGVKLEEGLLFGAVSEEFSFMTVSPEPENGWAAYFAQNDDYRKLFAVLARPNCLELLELLYSEKEHYIVAEAAAAHLGLPTEEVAALFEEMYNIHLLHRQKMELASGMVDTYIVNENFAFVPFMLAGRCLIEENMAFYVQWITRKSPLLRKPQKDRKEETKS